MAPRTSGRCAGWEIVVLPQGAVPDGQSRLAIQHDPDSAGRFCYFDTLEIVALSSADTSAASADAQIAARLRAWWQTLKASPSLPPLPSSAVGELRQGLTGRFRYDEPVSKRPPR